MTTRRQPPGLFNNGLPPEALAKLQRLMRTKGMRPTADLLKTSEATLDFAMLGRLRKPTCERLVLALAAVP